MWIIGRMNENYLSRDPRFAGKHNYLKYLEKCWRCFETQVDPHDMLGLCPGCMEEMRRW